MSAQDCLKLKKKLTDSNDQALFDAGYQEVIATGIPPDDAWAIAAEAVMDELLAARNDLAADIRGKGGYIEDLTIEQLLTPPKATVSEIREPKPGYSNKEWNAAIREVRKANPGLPSISAQIMAMTARKDQRSPDEWVAEMKANPPPVDIYKIGYTDSYEIPEDTGKTKHSVKEGEDAQRDLFASPGISGPEAKTQSADTFHLKYEQVEVGTIQSGWDHVNTHGQVAHLVASLRKHAQEAFMVVVTNKNGKVVNLIRHSKGTRDGASVYPLDVVGAVAATPGAASYWLIHNHPSGTPDASNADLNITRKIHAAMDGMEIRSRGHVIIADQKYHFFGTAEGDRSTHDIPAYPRRKKVAVTERILKKRNTTDLPVIERPLEALRYIGGLESDSGIALFNNRNKPIGVVALTPDEMSLLRDGKQVKRILSAFDATNAAAIMVFAKKGGVRQSKAAIQNVLNWAGAFAEIRVLDAFYTENDQLLSYANTPLDLHQNGPFFSRTGKRPEPPFYSELTRQLEAFPQKKASAEQWSGIIAKMKGVKLEEIEYSQVMDWLENKRTRYWTTDDEGNDVYNVYAITGEKPKAITKDEIVKYIKSQEVEIETIHLVSREEARTQTWVQDRAQELFDEELDRRVNEEMNYSGTGPLFERYNVIEQEPVENQVEGRPRVKHYALPNVEAPEAPYIVPFSQAVQYIREQLRPKARARMEALRDWQDHLDMAIDEEDEDILIRHEVSNLVTDVPYGAYYEFVLVHDTQKYNIEGSPNHFPQDNQIVTVRVTVQDIEGKKTLVIQEVQGDIRQRAQKNIKAGRIGYRPTDAQVTEWQRLDDRVKELVKEIGETSLFDEDGNWVGAVGFDEGAPMKALVKKRDAAIQKRDEYAEEVGLAMNVSGRIMGEENVPFKDAKVWGLVAMKRMIRYAAENDFDQVAWTGSQIQIDRYQLSEYIETLEYRFIGGLVDIWATDADGMEAYEQSGMNETSLTELIGADITAKIMAKEGQVWGFPQNVLDAAIEGGMTEKQARQDIEQLMKQSFTFGTEVIEGNPDYQEVSPAEADHINLRITNAWQRLGLAVDYAPSNLAKPELSFYSDDSGYIVTRRVMRNEGQPDQFIDQEVVNGLSLRTDAEQYLREHGRIDLTEVFHDREYNRYRLEGVDLMFGGEGMTAFYDQILLHSTNKFIKKFGARAVSGQLVPAPDLSETINIPIGKKVSVRHDVPRYWFHTSQNRGADIDYGIDPHTIADSHKELLEMYPDSGIGMFADSGVIWLSPTRRSKDDLMIDGAELNENMMRTTGQVEGFAIYRGAIPRIAIMNEQWRGLTEEEAIERAMNEEVPPPNIGQRIRELQQTKYRPLKDRGIWKFIMTRDLKAAAMKGFPMFRKSPDKGSKASQVKRWTQSAREKLGPWVKINIYQSVDEAREKLDTNLLEDDASGFYFLEEIHMIADNIENRKHSMTILAHEVVGHLGLETMLGKVRYAALLGRIKSMKRANNKEVMKIIRSLEDRYVDEFDEYNLDPDEEAQEVLAHITENKPRFGKLREMWNKLWNAIKTWLADHGIGSIDNAYIESVIIRATDHVQQRYSGHEIVGGDLVPVYTRPSWIRTGQQRFADRYPELSGKLEMDFDKSKTYYHGTNAVDFEGFDPDKGYGGGPIGVWLDESPEGYDMFMNMKPFGDIPGGRIIPVHIKNTPEDRILRIKLDGLDEIELVSAMAQVKVMEATYNRVEEAEKEMTQWWQAELADKKGKDRDTWVSENGYLLRDERKQLAASAEAWRDARERLTHAKMKDPWQRLMDRVHRDMGVDLHEYMEPDTAIQWRENSPYDRIELVSTYADTNTPRNWVIVRDPSHIRSIHAEFDPAKADSTNLLYARTGKMGQNQRKGTLSILKKEYPVIHKAVMAAMKRMPKSEATRIKAQLKAHSGTGWSAATVKSLAIREAFHGLIRGRENEALMSDEFWGNDPLSGFDAIPNALRRGAPGVKMLAQTYNFIGNNRKAENDISASFINCNPSTACATFCYAVSANARHAELMKAEFTELATEMFPSVVADNVYNHFKQSPAGLDGLMLRINDKGDLSPIQLTLIDMLNKRGMSLQIFSKRPGLLRQTSSNNLKMLSIDETNFDLALQNKDLRLAVTLTDGFTEAMVEQINDRVAVYLPVNLKGTVWSPAILRDKYPKMFKAMQKHVCPVESGQFETMIGTSYVDLMPHRVFDEAGNPVTTKAGRQKMARNETYRGILTCTFCDKMGSFGCFHGNKATVQHDKATSLFEIEVNAAQNEADLALQKLEDAIQKLDELGAEDAESRKRTLSAIREGVRLPREESKPDPEATGDKGSGKKGPRYSRVGKGDRGIATGETEEVRPKTRIGIDHKEASKRVPALQASMAEIMEGKAPSSDYERVVREHKPVDPYDHIPDPASKADMQKALSSNKVDKIGMPNRVLSEGAPVGLRLDIPAYTHHGVWVVSVHGQRGTYDAGKVVGYDSVAQVKNATFGSNEKVSQKIARGGPKSTIAVIKGEWVATDPESAIKRAGEVIADGSWTQVGFDPERHSYFYDRYSLDPVVAADEVVQVGPLVMAKNPKYSAKSDFVYSRRGRRPRSQNNAAHYRIGRAIHEVYTKGTRLAKREIWGAIGLRQIAAQVQPLLPTIQSEYLPEYYRMETIKNLYKSRAGEIATYRRKNLDEKQNNQLSIMQHAATIAGVDPDVPYTALIGEQEARDQIKIINEQIFSRPGEGKAKLLARRKQVEMLLAQEKNRKKVREDIENMWSRLNGDQKVIYRKERDFHVELRSEQQTALIDRIGAAMVSESVKIGLMTKMRVEFESQNVQAPYFPLARFGQYWIHSNLDGVPYFDMFETSDEWIRHHDDIEEQGATILGAGKNLDEIHEDSSVSPEFVQRVDAILGEIGDHPTIDAARDRIYQLYLESLPELSARKHAIHRKKTAGFYQDHLRAFAHSAQHGTNMLARMRHGYKLQAVLSEAELALRMASSTDAYEKIVDELEAYESFVAEGIAEMTTDEVKQRVKDYRKQAEKGRGEDDEANDQYELWKNFAKIKRQVALPGGAVTGENYDPVAERIARRKELLAIADNINAQSNPLLAREMVSNVLSELRRTHAALLNPNVHPLAQAALSVGFTMYLGLSPAAAMVNMTQTPVVAMPMIAAKFGWKNTNKEMAKIISQVWTATRAAGDSAGHKYVGVEKLLKTEGEVAAFKRWHDEGLLDKTMAHDLQGISDEGIYSGQISHQIMGAISFMFHHAERLNREVTALTAYRVAVMNGQTPEEAARTAEQLTWNSHFDYSQGNRPRVMRGNWMRVITQFKQYSQNITYTWASIFKKSFIDNDKISAEERREAKRAFFGMMLMQWLAAGLFGLPLVMTAIWLAEAMTDWDDDDPTDYRAEIRQFLADYLGNQGGRAVSKGMIDAFTPLSMHGRLTLSDLWLRTSDRDLRGSAGALDIMKSVAGPVFGSVPIGLYRGAELAGDGKWYRGLEQMMPKFVKDPMKAARYLSEDAKSLRGTDIMDMSLQDIAVQTLGFSPSDLADVYDQTNTLRNRDKKRSLRRSILVDQVIQAEENNDASAKIEAEIAVEQWNAKNPDDVISGTDVQRSFVGRHKIRQRMKHGLAITQRNFKDVERFTYGESE